MHVEYEYERKQPPDALITKGKQKLKFNLTKIEQGTAPLSKFRAMCGIRDFATLNCNDPKSPGAAHITFRNAFNPNLVLGSNK